MTLPRGWMIVVSLFSLAASASAMEPSITLGAGGRTDRVILIDPAAPESLQTAAEELKTYLGKVAGFTPAVVTSERAPAQPFISLGATAAAKAARVDRASLNLDGFRIVTRGGNIFILGPDTPAGGVNDSGGVTSGTANGVYTFIEDYLGVRWLMPGELGEEFEPRQAIELPAALDRSESPVFGYRNESSLGPARRSEWWRRMKLGGPVAVSSHHAWAEIVPAALFDQHPEWFGEVKGKREKPGSGTNRAERFKLETTNPELVKYYAAVVIAKFRADPNRRWYSVSATDGSYGWSESAETRALLEKDPDGNLSRTRLLLTFYNDVARIVGKEFPDHKLGGYIYASFLYPPAGGIPKIEPNVSLSVAPHIDYGFQLYRPSTREKFEKVMSAWAAIAKANNVDLYYYDLPTWIRQYENITTPPAPEILNLVFRTAVKHGFNGAEVYGRSGWGGYAAGNYAIAKLLWNPQLDAHELVREHWRLAFDPAAAAHVERLYAVLEDAFRAFYHRHATMNYTLTPPHLAEIYAPNYLALEGHYVKAHAEKKSERQQRRLQMLGEVLARMQGALRAEKLLGEDVKAVLPSVAPGGVVAPRGVLDFP